MGVIPRLVRRTTCALAAALLGAAAIPSGAHAQEPLASSTSDVFRSHAGRVVKIEVVETSSAAKSTVGSGFYVAADGIVVTNYHVISSVVTDPDRYRVGVVQASGDTLAGTVAAIDVVHDLAVVRVERRDAPHFALAPAALPQGARIYALGHPHDLGLSIVEGTYNGPLQHALYDRIHFTGSLNPGMSGGPAITADGRVTGVNVSTAGNQVSFLVPVERVLTLVAQARAGGFQPPERLLDAVREQVAAHQDDYLRGMFEDAPTTTLGGYIVPTQPASFFKCWADVTTTPEEPYRLVDHRCSTDDHIFIAGAQSSGIVELRHRLLTSNELGPFRMASLLEWTFVPGDEEMYGDQEHVTSFRCRTRNIERDGHRLRAALCLRRYRKLDGLYDAVVKTVTLGDGRQGMVSTLTLPGVSLANAQRLAGRFLESIQWTN